MEFFLSCISPQAKKLFDVKKINERFKEILKKIGLSKIADLADVADEKDECLLVKIKHPAIKITLEMHEKNIRNQLKNDGFHIKKVFIKF
jgi:hypothetical protein